MYKQFGKTKEKLCKIVFSTPLF